MRLSRSLALLIVLTAFGCGSEEDQNSGTLGLPTQSACPSPPTLMYENFAKDFFEIHCLECHDSKKKGKQRNGAPADHNYDTLGGIRLWANQIDRAAAGGPGAINTFMPPDGGPTEVERRKLGEWIACGTP
jgi:hypothetical protein